MEIRLDKWLWAARFYKTRSLARTMIEGGKVQYNNYHTKPSKIVSIGDHITLWQGYNKIEVVVKVLSEQRKQASLAQLLYEETPESIQNRERRIEELKNNSLFAPHPDSKPNKKQRREIIEFKTNQF